MQIPRLGLIVASALAICCLLKFFDFGFAHAANASPVEASIKETSISKGNGKSVIYFVNGFDCGSNERREDQVAPIYLFFDLARSGRWDVIQGGLQKKDCAGDSLVMRASRTLIRRAQELKRFGYERVVFSGQSVGAWAILIAAQRPDFLADELVLISPANWGPAIMPDGTENPNFQRNKTEFLYYIRGITKPSVIVLFRKDTFDPGARGPETEAILSKTPVPYLLIDQPKELWGHGAGWLPAFDYFYGDCIERFLLTPQTGWCHARASSTTDFRVINFLSQIADANAKKLREFELRDLVGQKFISFNNSGGVEEDTFTSADVLKTESYLGVQTRKVHFSDSGYCYSTGTAEACLLLRKWDKDRLLVFDQLTNATRAWWISSVASPSR